jgi:hypothetical protein
VGATHFTAQQFGGFVDRYRRLWHEPDPLIRQQLISSLWAADCVEYIEAAEYHGHAEMEARVTVAYTEFVQKGRFVFRLDGEPAMHHDAISLTIGMSPTSGGGTVWMGSIFAMLNEDGLIQREYQFGRSLDQR